MISSLYDSVQLGYILVESNRLAAWHRFGVEGLGLHADWGRYGELAMRVDEHARRVVVTQGDAEDVVALGWQLRDEAALAVAVARLQGAGLEPTLHQGEDATVRGVTEFWKCVGPKRISFELFAAPVTTAEPLRMRTSGFVTGAGGLGHVAITTREPEAMQGFFESIFDARVSDQIEDRIGGIQLDFTFLRVNERHHSVAISTTRGLRMNPVRTSVHHFNLQAASLDDVSAAYRRCRHLGIPIANGIGQHPNDRELSFYVITPSGFEIELGCDAIVLTGETEREWRPSSYSGISLWGHFPESLTRAKRARQAGRALMSLALPEFTVDRGAR